MLVLVHRERVGLALDLLNAGLAPFVERELKAVHGDHWEEIAREGQPVQRGKGKKAAQARLDCQALLAVMWNQWNPVFARTLGPAERSLVSELRDVRNKWAHQEPFSSSDSYRALDSMERLLEAVSAEESSEIGQMRMDLLRVQFDEQRRGEMRKASFAPTEGKPQGGLKSWREVVTPHSDVVKGTYQQAEFAADLWQVYQNEGSDEYKNPTEFFRRTFVTEGLKGLLTGALLRLAGQGGNPVVELQTNFGGGKTHSMLALWHLFSGVSASDLPGVEELVKEAGVPVAPRVHRAVLVGTKISPGQTHKKPDGTVVRTLWGEIAWQLGGKAGYEMVKDDDEKGTNPGDTLKKLFNKFAPCLILIDEWVAYARQLRDEVSLPAGTFDVQFTFAHALSEAAKAAKQTVLVVSIPESKNEIGGSFGQAALDQLKNAIGRVESPWHPARPDESFEIVRRRLFEPMTGDQFVARDAVAKAFSELYGSQHQEFPPDCREASYERRIKMAYPIHPELFDRLHNDWSALDKFQRKDGNSAARREAAAVLDCRGASPRNCKNALVFLGADANRLRELKQAVRQFLAWDSIWDERETLNLDPFQTKQAETKRRNSDETVDARIPETYQWLIVPGQSDPKGEVEWTEIRLQGHDKLAVRACKKLRNEELLMVELGDVRLRHGDGEAATVKSGSFALPQTKTSFRHTLRRRLRDVPPRPLVSPADAAEGNAAC